MRRSLAIALNTYRESVRARIFHGLFALALATAAYSLVIGAYAVRNHLRVVSDVGSASISLYAIVVSVIVSATSLHRELELKTLLPILARPISRGQYLSGKYLGILLTMAVFVAANAGALLLAVAALSGRPQWIAPTVALGSIAVVVGLGVWRRRWATYLPIPWAAFLVGVGWWMAAVAPDDRLVISVLSLLALLEVAIVSAVAMVFAAFSSPFLSAIFTLGVFLVGRSADTLAKLPGRVFGETAKQAGAALARVVPNLMVYLPPRPLVVGEAVSVSLGPYLLMAALQSVGWSLALLLLAIVIFRRRDFT
jgi:Cu-processing system permease protein